MNTHDIELPPLPKASKMYDIPGYDEEELKAYARAAIESDRQRRGEPVAYHPCTPILIEGLKRLPGGSAILAEWDKARSKGDVPQPAEPGSTHHVHRGTESLPCYCDGTYDHPIGKETLEPMKVPSDADILFTLRHIERHLKCIDGAIPTLLSTARALLARYGQPVEPAKMPPGYVLIAEDYLEAMIGPERMDHLRRSCRFPAP